MKRSIVLPALLFTLAAACGGSTAVPLENAPRTPAAVGVISVKQGPNNNTVGKLHVQHLAPPEALREDLSIYVAWVRPTGADAWQNVGQLIVDESRQGTLELRVPYEQFDFSLSAESSGDATSPSEFIVMHGAVDARSES